MRVANLRVHSLAGAAEPVYEHTIMALRQLSEEDQDGACQLLNWVREEEGGEFGLRDLFRPFAKSPFVRLWRGQDDPPSIRLAAAALMANGRSPAQAIEILVDARKTASDAFHLQIDRALGAAYLKANRPNDAIEVANRMLDGHSSVLEPYLLKARALEELGRHQQLSELAKARLERVTDDPWALELLGRMAGERGEFDAAHKHWQRLKNLGKATPEVLCRLAWNALHRDSIPDWALDNALKANQQTGYVNPYLLYILAAVYAEQGKSSEARETLLQCIEARDASQPHPDDWYVLGRIAEQYALYDIAAETYRQVDPPKVPSALSPYARAQRRIRALSSVPDQ